DPAMGLRYLTTTDSVQAFRTPTLLHVASLFGRADLIPFLLDNGEDPTVTSGHPPLFTGGVTAFEIARDRRTRDEFRVYRSEHEGEIDGVDWSRARVPPPLTREQANEGEDRAKAKKRKDKERKKLRERRERRETEERGDQADNEAMDCALEDIRRRQSRAVDSGVGKLSDAQLRTRMLSSAYASAGSSWGLSSSSSSLSSSALASGVTPNSASPQRPVSPNTQRAIDRELRFQAIARRQQQEQQQPSPRPAVAAAAAATSTNSAARCTHSVVLGTIAVLHVHAHTQLYNVAIGKTTYKRNQYIQPVVGPRLSPVADFTKKEIRCRNADGTSPTIPFLCVKAGTTFSVNWRHHNDTLQDNMVSPSHRGPCMIYLGKVTANPDDIKWFKIYELGFVKESNKWCSDVARDNHGKVDVVIPKDLENGRYILRTELLALHKAADPMGAQFYPNCVHIHITGSNKKFLDSPPEYVSFPGAYKPDDKGILYNHRTDKGQNYVVPGPAVYPPVAEKPADEPNSIDEAPE
ncbi:hypothetical protein GGF44_003395, partial [Coemansia sp. RSA 1694]